MTVMTISLYLEDNFNDMVSKRKSIYIDLNSLVL